MKPTPRQVYLMKYMGPGHSFVRMSAFGTPSIIRHYEYMRPGAERNPSREEITAMFMRGWVAYKHDPNETVTNTATGKQIYGSRVVLTKAGEECLSPFLTPEPKK